MIEQTSIQSAQGRKRTHLKWFYVPYAEAQRMSASTLRTQNNFIKVFGFCECYSWNGSIYVAMVRVFPENEGSGNTFPNSKEREMAAKKDQNNAEWVEPSHL